MWTLRNNTSWVQLHVLSSEGLTVADLDGNGRAEIGVDFGGHGLWIYVNDAGWLQAHVLSPAGMAAGRLH